MSNLGVVKSVYVVGETWKRRITVIPGEIFLFDALNTDFKIDYLELMSKALLKVPVDRVSPLAEATKGYTLQDAGCRAYRTPYYNLSMFWKILSLNKNGLYGSWYHFFRFSKMQGQ